MEKILIKNIGRIYTGDVDQPVSPADSLLIEDGRIGALGKELEAAAGTMVIDAQGMSLVPGLLDCHVHVAVAEWSPRQSAMAWLDRYVNSGITGVISAGESHIPGRPRDAQGVVALALVTQKIYEQLRPGGMKVYGGALIPEKGISEEEFRTLKEAGVFHTGEFGLGSAVNPEDAGLMAEWGRRYGIRTMCHTGATYLEGTTMMDTRRILEIKPDVICHLCGGGIPAEGMRRFLEELPAQLEICAVNKPSPKFSRALIDMMREKKAFRRLMLGTDSPSGYGIFPHGVWEVITMLCSLCGLEPEIAIAAGSGNISRFYGISSNLIAPGYQADLTLCDSPEGSPAHCLYDCLKEGTVPGVAMVMIDGKIMAEGEKVNTAPPKRDILRR